MERGARKGRPRLSSPRPALLLPLFLCAAVALSAQSTPLVRCDALVGWNGVARTGRFAPVIVSVENTGAKIAVDVSVQVAWGGGLLADRSTRSFTRRASLGNGATRRLLFLIPMPLGARSLAVSVSSGASILARQDVDLRSLATTDRIVVAVSSDLTLDSLAGLGSDERGLRVVYPRIDDLPESWAGYDGVDMIVVHDTYFQQLRSAQVDAMEQWVAAGGTLVFTGGSSAFQHAGAGFGRLLPVEVTGLVQRGGLPSLASFAGVTKGPGRGSIELSESRPTTGVTVTEEGGVPLVVRRRFGGGTIWFTAFDPTQAPFTSWEGTLPLWRRMEGRERQPILATTVADPLSDPWMKAVLGTPALTFPSATNVLIFLAAYLALLLPLVLVGLSRGVKPRLRLLLFCLLAAAACLCAGLGFNAILFQPGPQILESSSVQVRSGDGLGLVTERIGLVTAMSSTVRMSVQSKEAAVDDVATGLSSTRGLAASRTVSLTLGDRSIDGDLVLPRFGSRMLLVHGVVPLPVTVEVARRDSLIHVELSNGSSLSLRGCFFWDAGRGYPIGDVAPHGSVARSFGSADGIDAAGLEGRQRLLGDGRKVDVFDLEGEAVESEAGALVAWLDSSPLPIAFAGARPAIGRPALSLLLVEAR